MLVGPGRGGGVVVRGNAAVLAGHRADGRRAIGRGPASGRHLAHRRRHHQGAGSRGRRLGQGPATGRPGTSRRIHRPRRQRRCHRRKSLPSQRHQSPRCRRRQAARAKPAASARALRCSSACKRSAPNGPGPNTRNACNFARTRSCKSRPDRATSGQDFSAYSFSVSPLFGCHFISFFSARPTAASSASANTVSTTMPAITVLMSKVPSACRIR